MNARAGSQPVPRPGPIADDEPTLPTITRDEDDAGWGADAASTRRERDDYERERPPHHE